MPEAFGESTGCAGKISEASRCFCQRSRKTVSGIASDQCCRVHFHMFAGNPFHLILLEGFTLSGIFQN
jgi:hypothetical protein